MINSLESFYGDKIYVAPNIPIKKIANFIGSIGLNIKTEDIVVLVDDTVFGSAKNGLIITKDYIYFKEQFEDTKIFNLNKSDFFYVSKEVLSTKIIDNHTKMIMECTQPDFADLYKLFNDINKYIASKKASLQS